MLLPGDKFTNSGLKGKDLTCYERITGQYLMLGHGYSNEMVLVEKSHWVKKATKWILLWNDKGSKNPNHYAVYAPACDDPKYVALGVFFIKSVGKLQEPSENFPAAVVHEDACEYVTPEKDVWNDKGSGADYDVQLKQNERVRTIFPVKYGKTLRAIQAYTLRVEFLPEQIAIK